MHTNQTVEKRELYKMSSSGSVVSSASSTTSNNSSRKTRVPKTKRRENIQISYLVSSYDTFYITKH